MIIKLFKGVLIFKNNRDGLSFYNVLDFMLDFIA